MHLKILLQQHLVKIHTGTSLTPLILDFPLQTSQYSVLLACLCICIILLIADIVSCKYYAHKRQLFSFAVILLTRYRMVQLSDISLSTWMMDKLSPGAQNSFVEAWVRFRQRHGLSCSHYFFSIYFISSIVLTVRMKVM